MRAALIGLMLAAALADGEAQPAATAPSRTPAFAPCTDAIMRKLGARCGTYEVYEDRAAGRGRTIALAFIVIPSAEPTHAHDALAILSGGPGEGARGFAGAFEDPGFLKLRQHRDVLLVDQRGTGGSNPLECGPIAGHHSAQSYLGDFLSPQVLSVCKAALAQRADLRFYTTPLAMADLDELRGALGYGRLDLFAISHGTRDAIDYMRRYPDNVRVAALRGVVPPGSHVPQTFDRDADAAMDGVLADCAAEPACARAYPDLRADYHKVFDRLSQGPVTAQVKNRDGQPEQVAVSRSDAAQGVRYALYSSDTANRIPLMLSAAAQGDWQPLAQQSLDVRYGFEAMGLYVNETCAQDVAFIPYDHDDHAGYLLGDYRLRQQKAACAVWPRAPIPPDFHAPFTSRTPILLISGDRDPATPAVYTEAFARGLPNARHVVIRHAGHGEGGTSDPDCALRLVIAAIDTADVKGLDATCATTMTRAPFVLPGQDKPAH